MWAQNQDQPVQQQYQPQQPTQLQQPTQSYQQYKLPEIIPQYYVSGAWVDMGSYYLTKSVIGKKEKLGGYQHRLTASMVGAACGHGHQHETPIDVAFDITGIKKKTFTKRDLERMGKGNTFEPMIRDWYQKQYQVTVNVVGLAVPKWEFQLGAATDGEVGTDGIIEIKSPEIMYASLVKHNELLKGNVLGTSSTSNLAPSSISNYSDPLYHEHINPSHYDQMQLGMRITNRPWCDYIVYANTNGTTYVTRVHFNQLYWDNVLWPDMRHFLDQILNPLIKEIERRRSNAGITDVKISNLRTTDIKMSDVFTEKEQIYIKEYWKSFKCVPYYKPYY